MKILLLHSSWGFSFDMFITVAKIELKPLNPDLSNLKLFSKSFLHGVKSNILTRLKDFLCIPMIIVTITIILYNDVIIYEYFYTLFFIAILRHYYYYNDVIITTYCTSLLPLRLVLL